MDVVVFFFAALACILGAGAVMGGLFAGILKITTVVADRWGDEWGAVAYVSFGSAALAAIVTVIYAVT